MKQEMQSLSAKGRDLIVAIGASTGGTEAIFDVVKEELESQNKDLPIYMCESLAQTVTMAKKLAKPGSVVLFSPASASFDMFKDFADRGNQFKKIVNEFS